MKPKAIWGMISFGVLLGAGWLMQSKVDAAAIEVTTTADDNDVNGNCTLREAIRAANLDQAG